MMARNRKIMLQEKKRERLDSQDVYDMIFNAYEKRPLWTVKDLADFTGQPTAYIQELIADICVLNKKDHRHAYELKPEYKDN
ncbi:transcription initiation factor TFIIF subunit beta [Pancytospora epiphaga]|nr:transcription initiation factor TFIIF subunit beta [Pancytospora epiphaga]